MADDRLGTLAEAQIGTLQAYAGFLEELVASMLVARMAEHKAEGMTANNEPAARDAQLEADARNAEVRVLFERGASMRLVCAKVGALPIGSETAVPGPAPGSAN
jgi:hypothetical protein